MDLDDVTVCDCKLCGRVMLGPKMVQKLTADRTLILPAGAPTRKAVARDLGVHFTVCEECTDRVKNSRSVSGAEQTEDHRFVFGRAATKDDISPWQENAIRNMEDY